MWWASSYLRAFGLLLVVHSLPTSQLSAQLKGGLEQYYYMNSTTQPTFSPRAYYDDSKNWHREIRYNYEAAETFSLYFGKSFEGGEKLGYSFTPMMGVSVGQFTGASPGVSFELTLKRLAFTSESQYSFSMNSRADEFFFTWTEARMDVTRWLSGGIAFQQTNCYKTKGQFDPGGMLALTWRDLSFPVYVFNPGNKNRYYVFGLSWEWETKKRLPVNVTVAK
jgi:hypothetical protein